MTALIERLIDLVISWVKYLLPFHVLGDDMVGLVRRLGVYHRTLTPGWNWKVPVIEEVQETSGAFESSTLPVQTITTRDGRAVSLSGVLGYHVTDARKYLLQCGDAAGIMSDIGCGVIGEIVPGLDFAQVMGKGEGTAASKCRTRMRTKAEQWGIEIDSFGFTDRVAGRVIHVLGMGDKPK